MRPLSESEIAAIESNLFCLARSLVREKSELSWHRDRSGQVTASRPNSSQAFAVDFFGTIGKLRSRNSILNAWTTDLGLTFPHNIWTHIDFEVAVPKELLNEIEPTQLDIVAGGNEGSIFFECKFTESDGGKCSQPNKLSKGKNTGKRQCNGNYELQRNPVSNVESRCALTGKGIRYWDFIPGTLNISESCDYRPCPFKGGWFQWMRNLVAARALSVQQGYSIAFILVYADGPFPMARKVREPDWIQFLELTKSGAVPVRAVSYQKMLATAKSAASDQDRKILNDLCDWMDHKIKKVSSMKVVLK